MDTYKIDWLKIAKRLSPYNIKKGLLYMKHFGPKEFWIRLTERFQADDVDYEEWYKNHKPTMEELQRQRDTEFEYEPLISILVPVYNTPEEFPEADDPVGEKTDIWQMGTVHCECESCQ